MKLRTSQSDRYGIWGYFFVLPFLLAFLTFQLYPILYTFYLSGTDMKGASLEHSWVGFDNFLVAKRSIELRDLTEDDGQSWRLVLDDAGIAFGTDLPAPDLGGEDPFALDLDFDTPEGETGAEGEEAAAVEETVLPTSFTISMTRLEEAEFETIRQVLSNAGMPEETLEKASGWSWAGLIFDGKFWEAFGNTWILWGWNFVPQMLFALLFAVWFTDASLHLKGVGLFKAIYYLPNIITTASVAVLFASLFGYPQGPFNQMLLQFFKIDEAINFFRDPTMTRGVVSFIQFWMWFGSTIIVLSAGIMGIPQSLYESAVVDGANSWISFTRITLPLLRPVMSYTLVTSIIGGMQMFDIPFLLTNRRGDPNGSIATTPVYLYNQAFGSSNNYSYAATISVGMFILILALAMIVFFMMKERETTAIASRKEDSNV